MNIQEIREKLGLSVSEFAGKLDVAWTTVSRWEDGSSKPRKRMAAKITGLSLGVEKLESVSGLVPITIFLKRSDIKRLMQLMLD